MASAEPSSLITECPNCHTRFRVGESQLQIAHGRVRCGACLAVFAGVDHLLLDETETAPELTSENTMLESVLAELGEANGESGDAADSEDQAATAARAYELEALAARREETRELDLPGSSQSADSAELVKAAYDPAAVEEREEVEEADWTAVSVDTQELGAQVSRETGPTDAASDVSQESRASLDDALEDEDALRWWLEDEMSAGQGSAGSDDAMVVQLSELDAVRDDDLELQELLGQPESGSKVQLEALFRELREEEAREEEAREEAAREEEARQQETPQQEAQNTPNTPEEAAADQEVDDGDPAQEPASPETTPVDDASKRSTEELPKAIEEAEPLVSRAVTSSAFTANTTAKPSLASGRSIELVEPPSAPSAADSQSAQINQAEATPAQASPVTEEGAAVDDTARQTEKFGKVKAVREAAVAKLAKQKAAAEQVVAGRQAPAARPVTAEKPAAAAQPMVIAKQMPTRPTAGSTQGAPATAAVEAVPFAETANEFWEQTKAGIERFLDNQMALRLGTIVALALLVGQLLYSQFDDWAKSPTLRPLYAQVCAVTGCELPIRRSVQDMQSRKLAVRSHPDKADTLLVDALIVNEAEFDQPFPRIVLQFMDLNQQVVVSHELEPADYLDGELAGSKAFMAVRTPVHIDVEIADPGPKAVNYQLQFR